MYLTQATIREVEAKYGLPVEIVRAYELTPEQLAIVRLGQRHGRCHDVTLVIADGDQIVVTSKPSYPAGAYRTPSGGVEPGETFEAGAAREAGEETGLEVVLERYLIRAQVRFSCGDTEVLWISHVMQARAVGGKLEPLDRREIVEAKWASRSEILGPIRQALLASASPGLCYRADLDALAIERLGQKT
jgi:ADP-ribose pyrophosphatase YjhB (NUDIX family)